MFFCQCQAAGSDLGLTISGWDRLDFPPGYEPEDREGEGADLFGGG